MLLYTAYIPIKWSCASYYYKNREVIAITCDPIMTSGGKNSLLSHFKACVSQLKCFSDSAVCWHCLENFKKKWCCWSCHRSCLLMDVDCGLSIVCVKNSQVILIHRKVLELLRYLVLLWVSREPFFSPKDIFINTYPCFISVPPVDVFLLNIASLNKKNIMNCY